VRILGPSPVIVVTASLYMGYWMARVVAEPNAGIEIPIVIVCSAPIVWRLLRVGVWVNGDSVLLRNMGSTVSGPLAGSRLIAGRLDELSDFDRFTGGESRGYRMRLGDSAAETKLLRHRLKLNGKQHEIDAMMGRTPKGQLKAAERLRAVSAQPVI